MTAADSGTEPDLLLPVVEAITRVDPTADPALVRATVAAVVGGHAAKRRRLAQAIFERPQVLVDGQSPAPSVVGQLLLALRQAGLAQVSAPRCAGCGKGLVRNMWRRGGQWYCSVCAERREPCASCERITKAHSRDRDGRPLCARCTPADGAACLQAVAAAVATADPGIPTQLIEEAVRASAPKPQQLRRLAWAVTERPDLLTGSGHDAPTHTVLLLIDHLRARGATRIHPPSCPGCRRTVALVEYRDGARVCHTCAGKSREVECSRCGKVREPSARDLQGRPLCRHCNATDPANLKPCVRCGRRRRVYARTDDGPVCEACRTPPPMQTCFICGRLAHCETSKATGLPWCVPCRSRRARCAGCSHVRLVRSGTIDRPLCAACTPAEPGFWLCCPRCGVSGQLTAAVCKRCALTDRLDQLLTDHTGAIPAPMQALRDFLVAGDQPQNVSAWLNRQPRARSLLSDLATGRIPLTHDTFDALEPDKAGRYLRELLVGAGVLPPRDELLARLERWLHATIDAIPDPAQRHLVQQYTVWHLLRRLRRRVASTHANPNQCGALQDQTRTVISFLDLLNANHLTLATCTHTHVDRWLADGQIRNSKAVGAFLRWANTNKLTTVYLPVEQWGGPGAPIDGDRRWEIARRLLHDHTIDLADRVAGLLVVLYAQNAADVSRLTLGHLQITDDSVRIRLGDRPIEIPEPLATLTRELVTARTHSRSHVGSQTWLFPGRLAGRPITDDALRNRLARIDIHARETRTAALFQLATELPAAILARVLGIDIKGAVRWQRACAGDWTTYAADVSQRR
ncbi:hypothetical protein [Micromonospora globbae]|uniref:hypothetical protein n=1 Tax=Micromonospora globbae TaxID=1894969 RepID=UPI0034464092